MEAKPRVIAAALARSEMGREKARMRGKKPGAVSELEEAAERWKEGKDLKQAQLIYAKADDSPIAIGSVPLKVTDRTRGKDEEIIWRQQSLHPEERPRQVKMNAAMIFSIAQHLKAREWARAMGKRRREPSDGYNLEKAAEQWKREKELKERGLLGTNQRSA